MWKFNKDNWTYVAEDNIEEFLNGVQEPAKGVNEVKPKTKRSKKTKQIGNDNGIKLGKLE